jgi:hypothetical protein
LIPPSFPRTKSHCMCLCFCEARRRAAFSTFQSFMCLIFSRVHSINCPLCLIIFCHSSLSHESRESRAAIKSQLEDLFIIRKPKHALSDIRPSSPVKKMQGIVASLLLCLAITVVAKTPPEPYSAKCLVGEASVYDPSAANEVEECL